MTLLGCDCFDNGIERNDVPTGGFLLIYIVAMLNVIDLYVISIKPCFSCMAVNVTGSINVCMVFER